MMILEVLKRTWNEVRRERREAKKARKEVKALLMQIKNTVSEIYNAYESLSKVYKYLPEKERQDYVQKTLDLLMFTGSGWHKQTAHSFYNRLCSNYFCGEDLKLVNHFWNLKDWKNVLVVCERLKRSVENSIKLYKNEGKE